MAEKKTRVKRSNSEVSSSSSSSTLSFSSDEETDARDLKPIRGYLSNRRELARQLFKSVKMEKIRMMLPQILKNMNFGDLEEWCASELCGMSEARILSILDGQPMLESSDTSETDDSGPSLEIISDTEEWLTDTDVPIKEENAVPGAAKAKRARAKAKRMRQEEKKTKAKGKAKSTGNSGATILSDVKIIKTEKAKDNKGGGGGGGGGGGAAAATATKEGESLLDLLELEMRARAIRALIRKEEDAIPSAASETRMTLTANALRNTLDSAVSASLSTDKTFEEKLDLGGASAERNERERKARSSETVEDEDVVFVVTQPTPTIELLSSESENERQETDDKSIESPSNETLEKREEGATSRVPFSCDAATSANQRIVTINKSSDRADSLKIVITKNVSESFGGSSTVKSGKTKKSLSERANRNTVSSGSVAAIEGEKKTESAVPEASAGQGLFKKIRRKHNLRTKGKSDEESRPEKPVISPDRAPAPPPPPSSHPSVCSPPENDRAESEKKDEPPTPAIREASAVKIKIENTKETASSRISESADVDDRFEDSEEIIDLDDYPDDMDEIENGESADAKRGRRSVGNRGGPGDGSNATATAKEGSDSSETWATRYYQTDDVRNVIKESKIQSEIRKRLRERQRLSKLNGSPPKLNSPGDSTNGSEKTEEKTETKPTGSVQEYLALKNASASNELVESPEKRGSEDADSSPAVNVPSFAPPT